MISIEISPDVITRAHEIVEHEKILVPGGVDKSLSHKGPGAVWCGAVGQAAFERALQLYGVSYDFSAQVSHDYRVGGQTLDVKTKERAVAAQPHYEASAYVYNQGWQDPDWYAFVSLQIASGFTKSSAPDDWKYSHAHIGGVIAKERFKKIAKLVEEGSQLPNGQQAGFKSLNTTYSECEPVTALRRQA